MHVLSLANYRLRDSERKVVNRYTRSIGTSRALQTIQNKWKKGLETIESRISEILQNVSERQRNRLRVFKDYTATTTNYFFSLLASFLGNTSLQSFHYIYFLNISHKHYLKCSFPQW